MGSTINLASAETPAPGKDAVNEAAGTVLSSWSGQREGLGSGRSCGRRHVRRQAAACGGLRRRHEFKTRLRLRDSRRVRLGRMNAIARRFEEHRKLCPGAMVGGNHRQPVGDRSDQSRTSTPPPRWRIQAFDAASSIHAPGIANRTTPRPPQDRGGPLPGPILRQPIGIILRLRHIFVFGRRDAPSHRPGEDRRRAARLPRRAAQALAGSETSRPMSPSLREPPIERRLVEQCSGRRTGGSKEQFHKLPTFRGCQRRRSTQSVIRSRTLA